MGEAAEMMLNGLLCSECGGWMEDFEEPGYPRVCEDCSVYQLKEKKKNKKKKGKGAKKHGNK